MKTRSMKLIVVGIFASMLARAQEPISFRNLSLGGVVNDKLDLIYDPVQLRYIDSLMLYTNLSNLTSSNEQIFANRSDNEYLIGISDKDPYLMNHWISALVRVRNNKTPQPVNLSSALNFTTDMVGTGSLTSDYSSYYDATGDGLYDYNRQIMQDVNGYRSTDGQSFVVNNSFMIDAYTVGVKLGVISSNEENNFAPSNLGIPSHLLSTVYMGQPSFTKHLLETDLKTNKPSWALNESGDFLSKTGGTRKRIDASVMAPVSGFEVRADLCAYTIDEKSTELGSYQGAEDDFPTVANAVDRYQEEQDRRLEDARDGSAYGIGAGLRYIFRPSIDRTMQGFADINASVIGESYDYISVMTNSFHSFDENNLVGYENFSDDVRLNEEGKYSGPGTTTIISLNGRINIPLRNGIYVGLGVFFSSSAQDINANYTYSYRHIQNYTTIDAVTNSLDYTEDVSAFEAGTKRILHSTTDTRMPVGIEYRFTESKAWAVRFGAVFEQISIDDNISYQVTSSQPEVIKRTDGSGTTRVTTWTNSFQSEGSRALTRMSRTYYTHGLGYNPTDNLQIDLLGFFSANGSVTLLDYLKSLRLSFVLQI